MTTHWLLYVVGLKKLWRWRNKWPY